jgi:hypothetical protein
VLPGGDLCRQNDRGASGGGSRDGGAATVGERRLVSPQPTVRQLHPDRDRPQRHYASKGKLKAYLHNTAQK